MRKKKILQVVEGKVITPEQDKRKKQIQSRQVKVSRTNHERMRQRDWDYGALGNDEIQHFKSL